MINRIVLLYKESIAYEYAKMAEHLSKKGDDIKDADKYVKMVELLLAKGADPGLPNDQGKSFKDIIQEYPTMYQQCEKYLVEKEAIAINELNLIEEAVAIGNNELKVIGDNSNNNDTPIDS
jgi:hypothetical protein